MTTLTKPAHKHDCEACVYLGSMRTLEDHPKYVEVDDDFDSRDSRTERVEVVDFYACEQSWKGYADWSLIYRTGEYGDYYSGCVESVMTWAKHDPYFAEVLRRWVAHTSRA